MIQPSAFFKKKWASIFIYFFVAFLFILSAFSAVLSYSSQTLQMAYLSLPAVLAIVSFFLFIQLARKWKAEPSIMFLLIAMPSVFSFCLLMLPGNVPDEYVHICRMFSLATSGAGDMIIPTAFANADFPNSYSALNEALSRQYYWTDSFVETRNMSTYFPHMYLLPGIVSELLEILNANPFLTIYICRGVNAVIFLFAGYWAMRILPLGKTVLFIYLLNPMLTQQEASCSADAVVNMICLLFIAVVLNARFTKGSLHRGQIVGIVVLSVLIPCSKFVYTPLLLLLFILLPRIASKKTRIALPVCFALLACLAIVYAVGFYHGEGALGAAIDLVRDPFLCTSLVAKTLSTLSFSYIEQFAGHSLGKFTIPVAGFFFVLFYCLLTASIFTSIGEKFRLNRYEKILIWGITIAITLLLMLCMRQWSVTMDLREDVLAGVQGRYFLPFALLPFLTGINPEKHIQQDNALIGFGIPMICIQVVSLAAICIFFL